MKGGERGVDMGKGAVYVGEGIVVSAGGVSGLYRTDCMLSIARERTQQRGISNVSFRIGDAQNLPFESEEFDLVVSRLALHHVQNPLQALREMTRVLRHGGTVLIEDLFASEHPDRAAYHDRWEILRDPSHVRAIPLSELLQLFRNAGLEIESVTTHDDLTPEVERWLATTQTPPDRAAEVRRLLEEDRLHDLSGTCPFHDATGRLHFHARTE